MVGWQLGLTAVPLPLILYVAYAAIEWPVLMKQRVESGLKWIAKWGCASCRLFKVRILLFQIVLSVLFVAVLLAVYGIPSVFFGSRGAFIGAAAVIATSILVNLLWHVKNAQDEPLRRALLNQVFQAFAVLTMALLWLYSQFVFTLVVAADNALQALVAWWLVARRVRCSGALAGG